MNIAKKLLLVIVVAGLSLSLIGMDETKEHVLARVKKSGYMAQLVDRVDEDMTADNYGMGRIHRDLVTSQCINYQTIVLQILAGCDINPLLSPDIKVDFKQLCAHLIPILESRYINKEDEKRVKTFLQNLFDDQTARFGISTIETIEVPENHIALADTRFFNLADQVADSKSDLDTQSESELDEPSRPGSPAPLATSDSEHEKERPKELIKTSAKQPQLQQGTCDRPDSLPQSAKSSERTAMFTPKIIGSLAIGSAIVAAGYYYWKSEQEQDTTDDRDLVA